MGLLSLIVWIPVVGAILAAIIPSDRIGKLVAGTAAAVSFALSVLMLTRFEIGSHQFQLVEFVPWLESFGVNYRLGVDGISLWLVVLTGFLTLVALAYSYYVEFRGKVFVTMVLLLQTTMTGTFLSLDLILFYTFFELSLVPMYFLIVIWGGEHRRRAAAKFFIYTFVGSIFMLLGMVTMAVLHQRATGVWSFSILDIQAAVANGILWTGALQAQLWIFWAFAIAFLIKSPVFPFHTWVPDTYGESPIAGPILSSVMAKMGSYGILRFCLPLFPDVVTHQIPLLMGLCVVSILFGAILGAIQPDVRRLLAYSSVSHMGFVLLGIFSLNHIGMVGGAYQQINHGITASALFLLIGFLMQRRGSARFENFGGLKGQMPILATLFLIAMLASLGLPGLNGFVGEFMAMMGAFQSGYLGLYGLNTMFVVMAGAGIVVSAGYLLYMFQRVFYGPVQGINRHLRDLKTWEIALAGSLILFIFWGGLYPSTFTRPMEASIRATQAMATQPVGQRPVWDEQRAPVAMREGGQ
jgi:NADH-quinone oxidoreductase subunit M